ncbi:MAG: hypothetical protein ABFC24_02255 [Methanoregulaceae archaeon]
MFYGKPCACGKRFIDEVFAHLYVIMVEEREISPVAPLSAVGVPLVHPGFSIRSPPYLPVKSLLLLSWHATKGTADRIMAEVPEVRGVVKSGNFIPGVVNEEDLTPPKVYELLAGCDVRADVFYSSHGPVVLYKQQSLVHIEFPRGYDPKIVSVERRINTAIPDVFVDACSGVGTLGLTAAQFGIRQVIMNDTWFAAAFWAAFNLKVNAESFQVNEVRIKKTYDQMKKNPVLKNPELVADTTGPQTIIVYQGDFRELYRVIPKKPVMTVLDIFRKDNAEVVWRIKKEWQDRVPGEVFIP